MAVLLSPLGLPWFSWRDIEIWNGHGFTCALVYLC